MQTNQHLHRDAQSKTKNLYLPPVVKLKQQ